MMIFPGRLAIQQRVLPVYRVPFFDLLGEACQGGISVYAGAPRRGEGISAASGLSRGHYHEGRNIHWNDPSSRNYLCWQRSLIRWLVDWDPNALIVSPNPRILSTRLAVSWMRRRDRPVLGWGLGVPRQGNLVERVLRLSLLRSLDGILVYSLRGAAEYRELGIENITVAYNAVSPAPTQAPAYRVDGVKDRLVVLFVGRLQGRKRIDILLRACRDLPTHLQPRLIIIGDGPFREAFENLAQEIYPTTSFIGECHGADLIPYYSQADLFALPGTGGLAVQQAMAHGLPVIVAQGDGTQDDLVRPENGWQVPPGDRKAFTVALQQALSDPERLRHMGLESFRIVAEEINLESMVESFVGALVGVQ